MFEVSFIFLSITGKNNKKINTNIIVIIYFGDIYIIFGNKMNCYFQEKEYSLQVFYLFIYVFIWLFILIGWHKNVR